MSGHWICDQCGYDGGHADYCVCLRPEKDKWKGHRTKEEMKALAEQIARAALDEDAGK
jgi:hypothetical protein